MEAENEGSLWGWRLEWDETEEEELIMQHLWPSEPPLSLVRSPSPLSPFNFSGLDDFIMQHLWSSEPPLSLFRSPSPLPPSNLSGLDVSIMENMYPSEPPLSLVRCPSPLPPSNLSGLDVSLMENMYPSEPPLTLSRPPSTCFSFNFSGFIDFLASFISVFRCQRYGHTIFTLRNVLRDAEDWQADGHAVRHWLERLLNVVFDAEDFFDEFAKVASQRQLQGGIKFKRELLTYLSSYNNIVFSVSIALESKTIRQKLDAIAENGKKFDFIPRSHEEGRAMNKMIDQIYSFVHALEVVLTSKNLQNFDGEKGKRPKTKISLQDIQELLPKNIRLVDAAKTLGVSKSTLKRRCREFKIKWPSSRRRRQLCSNQSNPIATLPYRGESSQVIVVNPANPAESLDGVSQPIGLASESQPTMLVPAGTAPLDGQLTAELGSSGDDGRLLGENNLQSLSEMDMSSLHVNARVEKQTNAHDIFPQFPSQHLAGTAEELEVSRSTLKRRLRESGIKWPSSRRRIKHCSNQSNPIAKLPYRDESSQVIVVNPANPSETLDAVSQPIGLASKSQPPEHLPATEPLDKQLTAEIGSSGDDEKLLGENNLQSLADEICNIFTVKAKYKKDNIKFDFSLTSNLAQLKEEVGKRLCLPSSSFKITYYDDDDDDDDDDFGLITITCDSDLQYFLSKTGLPKCRTVKLFIFDSS